MQETEVGTSPFCGVDPPLLKKLKERSINNFSAQNYKIVYKLSRGEICVANLKAPLLSYGEFGDMYECRKLEKANKIVFTKLQEEAFRKII